MATALGAPQPILDPSVRLTLRLLVGQAVRVYRHRFLRVAVPAVCILVPLSMLEAITEHLQHHFANHPDLVVRILVAIESVAAAAVGLIGFVFFAGLLDRLIGAHLEGHDDPPVREVLHTLPYWRLVRADLLYIVLAVAGFVLFIVPGLLVMTFFGIIGPVINVKGVGVIRAFRESARLVRSHVVLVFFAVTVPVLVENQIDGAIAVAVWKQGLLSGLVVNSLLAATLLAFIGLLEVVLAHGLIHRDAASAREAVRRPPAPTSEAMGERAPDEPLPELPHEHEAHGGS